MRRKICLLGSNYSWSLETYYSKHLKDNNHIKFDFLSLSEFKDKHYTFASKITNHIFPNRNYYYNQLNKYLIDEITRIKPDILIIFKGMEIYPETIEYWSKQGFLISNYNPDHPFIIDSKGGGNFNVTNSVGLYHHHFCYSINLCNSIKNDYKLPTTFLPFGFELNKESYEHIKNEQEINRVCFLGNPDKKRAEILRKILESGFPVDVYGHNWHKTNLVKNKNINIYPAVIGLQFWEVLKRYKVQLNIFRRHNLGSHNMRTFEIPAVGAIQLAPYSEEQLQFFRPEEEIFFYDSEDILFTQIEHLLNLEKQKSAQIRQQARQRSITSDYSYANRAALMVETLVKL